jgi:DnaJ like chaperone protein
MAFVKWLGGVVGFVAGGPLGALLGFVLGSLFEEKSPKAQYNNTSQTQEDINAGQRNSFMFSLMVLASYIIKADGKVMHSEMELVRRFLRVNFGEDAVNEGNEILLKLFEHRKQVDAQDPYAFKRTINDCGRQIAANMSYEQRLQLLNFLAMIAKADGHVCDQEIVALREVAAAMGLSASEVDSMLNLGTDTLEAAYKVLEISPSATDDEVKAAYRKLAMKHHPDRVASLGEDVRKAAEEKFRQLNEAKEKIYKARGLN